MQKAAVKKKAKVRTGRRTADYYDYNLLAAVILLVCFGLVMLYSTSSYEAQLKFEGNDMYYFTRQAVISAAAILLAVLVSRLDYHLLIPVSGLAYVGSLVLMAMVKYTPLGVSAYGARRWLNMGIQFQPSEVAKIAVIIYLPVVIIKMGRQFKTLKAVMVLLGLGALQAVAALVWTDNLSTGLIIGGIAVLMIFVAHPDTKWFVGVGSVIAAVVGIAVAYMGMTMTTSDNFRIRRILSWLHPEENMSGGGYQVMQSLYAIGSGGFFGKGLGNSAQKLGTIPEAQNDMIFSIVCEELGVFGGVLLILMFLYLHCPERSRPLRYPGGQRYFRPYRTAGNSEYLRGNQSDAYHGNHPAFCQLRRNLHHVFDDGNRHCPQRIPQDSFQGYDGIEKVRINGLTNV